MADETADQKRACEAREAAAAAEESGHPEAAKTYEAIANWINKT